ncbi:sulfurtransferase-like selenium metabolism protein YedF [Bacillus sp. FJAT-49705]|uniref:Sulfurtransferase-like selenium metabolism protein YedF n=1 Tax=Cytobacillus citreus TaxID=2833586 RepID=A0ABS5NV53_9BACI|nr:sulfurtransferase-like selenium metabolism protein YedF [Cytobacillus citreus]MBS4191698.1 sulfurtransferase-like selenium metabolism protein YedF [Cytobacillus citreus]
MVIDFTLDLRGEPCPFPVIYSLETLKDMKKGEVLQVIADCPASFKNVPEEVVKHGYTLAKEPYKDGQDLYFFIQV